MSGRNRFSVDVGSGTPIQSPGDNDNMMIRGYTVGEHSPVNQIRVMPDYHLEETIILSGSSGTVSLALT